MSRPSEDASGTADQSVLPEPTGSPFDNFEIGHEPRSEAVRQALTQARKRALIQSVTRHTTESASPSRIGREQDLTKIWERVFLVVEEIERQRDEIEHQRTESPVEEMAPGSHARESAEAILKLTIGLRFVEAQRSTLDEYETSLILEAREFGVSWQEVGDALGISRQAAYQRYTEAGQAAVKRGNERQRERRIQQRTSSKSK